MRGKAPSELCVPETSGLFSPIRSPGAPPSPKSTLENAAGTSSEGSRTPRTSPSCSSTGRSAPISPASPYFQSGLSSPLSPLCNENPITQLHLQTDFELYRLEQELGSGNVPDPLVPDPIFEEDFAAVLHSLEASTGDHQRQDTATLSNWQDCSFCSDSSCVEISARALDLEDIPPPARLQSITEWESHSVTLSPRAAAADDESLAAQAMFVEKEESGHPFSALKESEISDPMVTSVSIRCTEAETAPCSTEDLSDDSNDDIAWLSETLPWGHGLQQQETSDDFISYGNDKRDGANEQQAWPLGILAAGLTCLGSPFTDAQEAVMELMALLLAWHTKEGHEVPIKHLKDSRVSEKQVYFNQLYIIHRLCARSRIELLGEQSYLSDCSSFMTGEDPSPQDHIGDSVCIQNPLFCALDLPPLSPRSPRAQVPLPISDATDTENNDTVDSLPEAVELCSTGPESPRPSPSVDLTGSSSITRSEGPSSSMLATSESSLSMSLEPPAEPAADTPGHQVRDNADPGTRPLQSLRSRYESSSRSSRNASVSCSARSTLVQPVSRSPSTDDLADAVVRSYRHEGSIKDALEGCEAKMSNGTAKASAPRETEDERQSPSTAERPFRLSPACIARKCRALAEEEEREDLLGGLAGSSASQPRILSVAPEPMAVSPEPQPRIPCVTPGAMAVSSDVPCKSYANASLSSGCDGAMLRNAPSCSSCGSHDLICVTCGSKTMPHSHPESCISGNSGLDNTPPQIKDLCGMNMRKGPVEEKLPVGLFDEYMDICDELLRTPCPSDADSIFDVSSIGDASRWSPPREDFALAGAVLPGLHQELDSGEDVIAAFLSHQEDDYFFGDDMTFSGASLLGIGDASEMGDMSSKHRHPFQNHFIAQSNVVRGASTPVTEIDSQMDRHCSSRHEHNPSLATWLSTAISEHAIAQLPDAGDTSAAAAAEICSSPFGYQLQLDALEQDRMVLKDYLSSLREQHQVTGH